VRGAVELYDLSADAGETRDLAASHPNLVRRAEELMRREHAESEDWPLDAPPAVTDKEPGHGAGVQVPGRPRPARR
jgi:hypothetical protein